MRRIHKPLFNVRYRHKGRSKRYIIIIVPCLFALWCVISEIGLSSVSDELTEEAARNYVLSCINDAVKDELKKNDLSFSSLSYDESGSVSSVNTNSAALNVIKAELTEKLSRSLTGRVTARTPVGSLFGLRILNGRGPCVGLKLNLESSVDISFSTEFSSAGINQSCHRVCMTVKVRSFSQSKRFTANIEESTTTVLAETVIVGQAPGIIIGEK